MDDIAVVMQGISIDRAHVVGRSMGGDAALQFGTISRKSERDCRRRGRLWLSAVPA